MDNVLSLVPTGPAFDIVTELRGLADEYDRGERDCPDTFLWVADGESLAVGVIGMASPASVVGLLHIAAAAQAREAIEE